MSPALLTKGRKQFKHFSEFSVPSCSRPDFQLFSELPGRFVKIGEPSLFLGTLPISLYLSLNICPLASSPLPSFLTLFQVAILFRFFVLLLLLFLATIQNTSARSISVTEDGSCFNFLTDDLSYF